MRTPRAGARASCGRASPLAAVDLGTAAIRFGRLGGSPAKCDSRGVRVQRQRDNHRRLIRPTAMLVRAVARERSPGTRPRRGRRLRRRRLRARDHVSDPAMADLTRRLHQLIMLSYWPGAPQRPVAWRAAGRNRTRTGPAPLPSGESQRAAAGAPAVMVAAQMAWIGAASALLLRGMRGCQTADCSKCPTRPTPAAPKTAHDA